MLIFKKEEKKFASATALTVLHISTKTALDKPHGTFQGFATAQDS